MLFRSTGATDLRRASIPLLLKKINEKPPLEKRKSNAREHTMYSPTPAGSQPLVDTSLARISLRRHGGVQSAKLQTLDLVDLCANKGMEALLYRTHNADK